jgi:hypothetical protein
VEDRGRKGSQSCASLPEKLCFGGRLRVKGGRRGSVQFDTQKPSAGQNWLRLRIFASRLFVRLDGKRFAMGATPDSGALRMVALVRQAIRCSINER